MRSSRMLETSAVPNTGYRRDASITTALTSAGVADWSHTGSVDGGSVRADEADETTGEHRACSVVSDHYSVFCVCMRAYLASIASQREVTVKGACVREIRRAAALIRSAKGQGVVC